MNTNIIHNIIIADSQFLIIKALESLIEADERYLLAGIAGNQHELNRILSKVHSGLLIADFTCLDFVGIDDLKNIRNEFPQIAILILTNSITKVELAALTRLGVKNIIYKTIGKEELFSAILYSLKGRKFYSEEILDLFLDQNEPRYIDDDPRQLTVSEMEIVKLIVGGMTTKEIASSRNISYHTVNTHRKNILRKLDVSNASELIIRAIKSGWIDNIEYYI
jgi:DNA-binding NarL/FixJ family response regulator